MCVSHRAVKLVSPEDLSPPLSTLHHERIPMGDQHQKKESPYLVIKKRLHCQQHPSVVKAPLKSTIASHKCHTSHLGDANLSSAHGTRVRAHFRTLTYTIGLDQSCVFLLLLESPSKYPGYVMGKEVFLVIYDLKAKGSHFFPISWIWSQRPEGMLQLSSENFPPLRWSLLYCCGCFNIYRLSTEDIKNGVWFLWEVKD